MTNQTFLFKLNILSEKYTPQGESKGFNILILSFPSKCEFVLGFGYCCYITNSLYRDIILTYNAHYCLTQSVLCDGGQHTAQTIAVRHITCFSSIYYS